MPSTARTVLTPAAIARLLIGWGSVGALAALTPALTATPATPVLAVALAVIVGIILVCSFGVVAEAEALADLLGDPYGTLVLTLSIALIEVTLISSVMLGPGDHQTIARDSVVAVSMIILNLVIGLSLVVGARRHGPMLPNRRGVAQYLMLTLLFSAIAFVLPHPLGTDGALSARLGVLVAVLVTGVYAVFLVRQMGRGKRDFQEAAAGAPHPADAAPGSSSAAVGEGPTGAARVLVLRTLLLIALALPIVLISQSMAALLDIAVTRAQAPVALSGLLIAAIVFLPETITSVRAGAAGEIQRVSNLCHGALVSTVGLTIPSVLIIGALTGQRVVLAASWPEIAIMAITLVLTAAGFLRGRIGAGFGWGHLGLFAVYAAVVLVG
ncbi:calcium:proton antiporter [Helcobacillus massiliensis]|uniref:calcium:proton antiporter n=1 Tax=Helcobacillus massiliensis TaxID=521392 RepID=UPI002556ADF8|nr:calcium:proton antiporter [Helcobacillus massiliensis]MDK7742909.1 calcium:proton antiporter [Helcobacillus massiliensis]WOO93554.1 calcium:proton antiporter [Helcobacillus massiliensis]